MTRDHTLNPTEDPKRNADQNAKAPLQDRPVSNPDRKVAQERPKTIRKTDADA